jgi:hypothetical protein
LVLNLTGAQCAERPLRKVARRCRQRLHPTESIARVHRRCIRRCPARHARVHSLGHRRRPIRQGYRRSKAKRSQTRVSGPKFGPRCCDSPRRFVATIGRAAERERRREQNATVSGPRPRVLAAGRATAGSARRSWSKTARASPESPRIRWHRAWNHQHLAPVLFKALATGVWSRKERS